jgi:hypothetical protein
MAEYIHLRLTAEVAAAIERKAHGAGLTVHAWSIAGLDAIVGRSDLPPDFHKGAKIRVTKVSGRRSLHPSDEQIAAYKRAAEKCCMPLATWATVTLGVLSGASELGEQLKKVA